MFYLKFDILPQDVLNSVAHAAGVIVALHDPTTYVFMSAWEILMAVRSRQWNRPYIRSHLCHDLSENITVNHIHLALRIPWVMQYLRNTHGYEFEKSKSEGTWFAYTGINFESRQTTFESVLDFSNS